MARKKWYSYFVVTDGAAAAGERPPAEPRRVEEVAPEAAAPEMPIAPSVPTSAIDDVYQAARIEAPAHGYTIRKVADMLQSEHLRSLPADVKRRSILAALDAAGVAIDDIVQDAVTRDRALDAYERVLEQHLAQVRSAVVEENARLESEIAQRVAELRARIDENAKRVAGEEEELRAWRTRKQREETAIAEAVGYFVSENPITAPPPAAAGDADVR